MMLSLLNRINRIKSGRPNHSNDELLRRAQEHPIDFELTGYILPLSDYPSLAAPLIKCIGGQGSQGYTDEFFVFLRKKRLFWFWFNKDISIYPFDKNSDSTLFWLTESQKACLEHFDFTCHLLLADSKDSLQCYGIGNEKKFLEKYLNSYLNANTMENINSPLILALARKSGNRQIIKRVENEKSHKIFPEKFNFSNICRYVQGRLNRVVKLSEFQTGETNSDSRDLTSLDESFIVVAPDVQEKLKPKPEIPTRTESGLITVFCGYGVKFLGLICGVAAGVTCSTLVSQNRLNWLPVGGDKLTISDMNNSTQQSPASMYSASEELSKSTFIVSQPIGVNLRTEPRFDKKSQVNIRFGEKVNPVVHTYKSSQSGETVSLGFPKVAETSHNSCLVDKNSARQCWVPIEWEGSQYWIWGEWLDVHESPKQLVQVDP
jgi:hypothetical protein